MREEIIPEITETKETKITVTKKTEIKSDKEKLKAGRKVKSASQKKKARQVFYSDDDFEAIEECAEIMSIEPQAFMQMVINQRVKAILKDVEED
jgi:hypothetical protein